MYVDFFPCPYPQVLPATGLGDYISPFGFTTPQYLTPGNCRGLGCAGTGCNCGMGLFDSGLDFSAWSYAEWAIVALGLYVVVSITNDVKRGASRAAGRAKKIKKGFTA